MILNTQIILFNSYQDLIVLGQHFPNTNSVKRKCFGGNKWDQTSKHPMYELFLEDHSIITIIGRAVSPILAVGNIVRVTKLLCSAVSDL